MGYGSICANLKSMAKGETTTKEKDVNRKLLQDHREAQALERKKAMHHREKSSKKPEQYMCLMIDGMDQTKTSLPHLRRLPKDFNNEWVVWLIMGRLNLTSSLLTRMSTTTPI